MPRTLFDQILAPATANRKRRWTTVMSLVLHGSALVALVAAPLASTFTLPDVMNRLVVVQLESVPPPPPPPPAAPPRPAVADVPATIPMVAPDRVLPGAERPPQASTPTLGLQVGDPGGVSGGIDTDRRPALTAPPPQVPSVPLRPGGQIRPPERMTYLPPVYPAVAQAARMEGTVILEAVIDESGAVRDVKVLRSIPLLDRAAIDAVSKWRYTPTRLNGVPVAIVMTVTVTFSLR